MVSLSTREWYDSSSCTHTGRNNVTSWEVIHNYYCLCVFVCVLSVLLLQMLLRRVESIQAKVATFTNEVATVSSEVRTPWFSQSVMSKSCLPLCDVKCSITNHMTSFSCGKL